MLHHLLTPEEIKILLAGIVGMDEASAKSTAAAYGYSIRVYVRDGECCVVTRDLRFDRINFDIADGKVIRADIG